MQLFVSPLVSVVAEAAITTRFALSFRPAAAAATPVYAVARGTQHGFEVLAAATYVPCSTGNIVVEDECRCGEATGVRVQATV